MKVVKWLEQTQNVLISENLEQVYVIALALWNWGMQGKCDTVTFPVSENFHTNTIEPEP